VAILKFSLAQRLGQGVRIELRIVAGTWHCADIDEETDFISA
jgi:hypothetical protein